MRKKLEEDEKAFVNIYLTLEVAKDEIEKNDQIFICQ
jgi:hypothetical protein